MKFLQILSHVAVIIRYKCSKSMVKFTINAFSFITGSTCTKEISYNIMMRWLIVAKLIFKGRPKVYLMESALKSKSHKAVEKHELSSIYVL